jgi:2-oxoglutarate decarboxylase
VTRIVLCAGKVAYDAMERSDQLGEDGTERGRGAGRAALPVAEGDLREILDRYPNAGEVVWLQEEPENMGAWNFVHSRLHRLLRETHTLRHVSRAESASPASGSAALHRLEQDDLLTRAVG